MGNPREPGRAEGDRSACFDSGLDGAATARRALPGGRARKRAAILTAEGVKQSQILTAEGEKQSAILRAEGQRQATILSAEGQAKAIDTVFTAIHAGEPDPMLLAYQYLQMIPQIAQGEANKLWIIPSEFANALGKIGEALPGAGNTKPEK